MNNFFEDQARGRSSGPDDIEDFLTSQAGSGVATYGGFRYHKPVMRGNGFFGRMIKGGLMPIIRSVMPYLGGKAKSAVSDFAEDIKQGKSFGSAAKRTLRKGVSSMASDLASTLGQDGGGVRRRRKRKTGGKKGKLNPGLRRYLEMKKKGLVGKPKPKKKRKRKAGKKKNTIKQRKRKGKKTTKKTTKKRRKPSKSSKSKPVNLLF